MAYYISSGVVSSGITLVNDYMNIYSGGVADCITLLGSYINVFSDGVASRAAVDSWGMITVSKGGMANDTAVNISGGMCIRTGGVASRTVISGGSMEISGGGVANDTEVSSGRVFIFSGGVANVTRVRTDGRLIVSSGGVANSAMIFSGGAMWISSGGTANITTVNKGSMTISGGVANSTTVNYGFMFIFSGGVVNSTTMNDGYMHLSSGGVANSTTINGGYMHISSGGVANSTTMFDGGMYIGSGGVADSTTMSGGGYMAVSSGGVASNTTVNSGGSTRIFNGGVVAGKMEIASGAYVSAYAGAIIDFTVAEQTVGGAALINDWRRIIDGGANYTITVKAEQAAGTYALAGGAANFYKTITVKTADAELGTITVGETLTVGNTGYTLNKVDGLLSLTIADLTAPPVVENTTTAEIILTISDANHPSFGATGGWKVQSDQTIVWQDLSTLSGDYQVLGQGYTIAGKAMTDIYIYSPSAKYIGVYTTDDTGAVVGFESIFTGENALMQVGLGDFNADGVSDLLLRTADGYLGFYANGAFTAVQGLGTEWSVEALGDVNGDGTTDMIISHTPGGYVGAYLIGKDGSITWGDLGSTEGGIEIVGAGDFNADGTDDVLVKSGSYYGAWLCGNGSVTGFFGIGTFDAEVQDIADYNADGIDDILFRTADGIIGVALITGPDTSTWAQYGALGAEWSTKGAGIL